MRIAELDSKILSKSHCPHVFCDVFMKNLHLPVRILLTPAGSRGESKINPDEDGESPGEPVEGGVNVDTRIPFWIAGLAIHDEPEFTVDKDVYPLLTFPLRYALIVVSREILHILGKGVKTPRLNPDFSVGEGVLLL